MNKFIFFIVFLPLYSFDVLAANKNCSDTLNVDLNNYILDGEPLSDLLIFNEKEKRKIELAFPVSSIKCKKINADFFRVSAGAESSRGMIAYYFFKNTGSIIYIGGIAVQSSVTDVYRATGVYDIYKGDDISDDITNTIKLANDEDRILLSTIMDIPYFNKKYSIRELYSKGADVEINLLAKSINQKICKNHETTIFYCKTKNNKILNLCYDTSLGEINYTFGDFDRIDINLSNPEYISGNYLFKNKETSYIVLPNENKIKVKRKNKNIADIDCFN